MLGATSLTFVAFLPGGLFSEHTIDAGYQWSSPYRDIRTRYDEQRNYYATSTTELPITRNRQVNHTLTTYIRERQASFLQAATANSLSGHVRHQHIGYQVYSATDKYISIAVNETQDLSAPSQTMRGWLFDLTSGREIRLSELLGGTLPSQLASIDRIDSRSFIITNRSTLGIIVDSDSGGEATMPRIIRLPAARIAIPMSATIAWSIFDLDAELPAEADHDPHACSYRKCIALTYDDGPSRYADRLLSILKKYDAKATFFVIGSNIDRHVDTLRHIHAAGMEVGSHSWSHSNFQKLSLDMLEREITMTNQKIAAITNETPRFIRPPYGELTVATKLVAERANMSIALWSIETRDWQTRNPDVLYNRVISAARPGAIIVMHDVYSTTVDASERIIETLSHQGYQFVALSELLGAQITPGAVYTSN